MVKISLDARRLTDNEIDTLKFKYPYEAKVEGNRLIYEIKGNNNYRDLWPQGLIQDLKSWSSGRVLDFAHGAYRIDKYKYNCDQKSEFLISKFNEAVSKNYRSLHLDLAKIKLLFYKTSICQIKVVEKTSHYEINILKNLTIGEQAGDKNYVRSLLLKFLHFYNPSVNFVPILKKKVALITKDLEHKIRADYQDLCDIILIEDYEVDLFSGLFNIEKYRIERTGWVFQIPIDFFQRANNKENLTNFLETFCARDVSFIFKEDAYETEDLDNGGIKHLITSYLRSLGVKYINISNLTGYKTKSSSKLLNPISTRYSYYETTDFYKLDQLETYLPSLGYTIELNKVYFWLKKDKESRNSIIKYLKSFISIMARKNFSNRIVFKDDNNKTKSNYYLNNLSKKNYEINAYESSSLFILELK